ncbi:MAG: hypothetical protein ABIL50_04580 [candidate division WOR-3 bacterium]
MKRFVFLFAFISCTQTYYTEEKLPGDLMIFAPESAFVQVFDSTGRKVSDGYVRKYNVLIYAFNGKPERILIVKASNFGCETLSVKIKEENYCPNLVSSSNFRPSPRCDVCNSGSDGNDTITIITDFDVVYVAEDSTCGTLKRFYKDNIFIVRGLYPGEYRVKVDSAEFVAYVSSRACNVLIAR